METIVHIKFPGRLYDMAIENHSGFELYFETIEIDIVDHHEMSRSLRTEGTHVRKIRPLRDL
jgi:hypothetical protein